MIREIKSPALISSLINERHGFVRRICAIRWDENDAQLFRSETNRWMSGADFKVRMVRLKHNSKETSRRICFDYELTHD